MAWQQGTKTKCHLIRVGRTDDIFDGTNLTEQGLRVIFSRARAKTLALQSPKIGDGERKAGE